VKQLRTHKWQSEGKKLTGRLKVKTNEAKHKKKIVVEILK